LSEPLIRFHASDAHPGITVDEGEMVILTAPPGGGTSAALRALAGEAPFPEGGQALVAGQDLARLSHRMRRRARQSLRLFHLPHDPPLISNLTVMENLLLPSKFLGESPEGETAREGFLLLEAAGVGWTAGLLPGSLPLEIRKAVALIRGFLRRPRVALLDDPLGELDDVGVAGIRPLLRGTLAAGRCAMLVAARDLRHFEGIRFRKVEMPSFHSTGQPVPGEPA